MVEITPRDQYRYGYRFWLEEQSGMLLRSALLDQEGEAIQQLSFVDIRVGCDASAMPELEPELDPEFTLENPPWTRIFRWCGLAI